MYVVPCLDSKTHILNNWLRSNLDFEGPDEDLHFISYLGSETNISVKGELLRSSRKIKNLNKYYDDLGLVANDPWLDEDVNYVGVTFVQPSFTVFCSAVIGYIAKYLFIHWPENYDLVSIYYICIFSL